ncbi:MAG: outer membrane protein assembly factor BamD [Candidatus Krumholzibacteriota bacterium]|nr:outer membrane protein assembly factor BamD [Candidatus Krumholzibacteriota bacterium]
MHVAATRIAAVVVAAGLATGCYGSKLIKGPINAEHASLQADSIRAETKELLEKIVVLERSIQEERQSRTRTQAQLNVTISELEESVRILLSRLDDNAQLRSSRRRPWPPRVVLPVDTSASDSTPTGSVGGTEEELYRAAYLDRTRGNYELAIEGFKNCLMRYPSGDYIVEVRYYLGECYYSTEQYLEAVSEFRLVVEEFPEARLAPAAYLKSARCYQQLEENHLAERAFRALLDKHPDTEEARQARAALDELEG